MILFKRKSAQERLTEYIDRMIRRDMRGGPICRRPHEIWRIQSVDWDGTNVTVTVKTEPR